MKVAVVLPAFNEELTIEKTLRGLFAELPEAQLIVVDNNSKDRTAELARGILDQLNAPGMVISECRQGKGNAVRRAFLEVDADVIVLCDADFTYPAARVHDLIAPIVSGVADMVVGDRLTSGHYRRENKRPFHSFGNALIRWLVNTLFRANLGDIMSGYRAFSAGFVKNYPILVEGFQLETDMTLHALDKRYRIVEVPVEYRDRPPGSRSKLSTIADGAKVLFTIAQIVRHYRPLLFFGSAAGGLAVFGVVAALPVFQDWFAYRYIYHVPLAMLAASLEVAAIVCLGVGLVLDSINHEFKMLFEREQLAARRDR